MRRILLLTILFIAAIGWAQTVYYESTPTLEWAQVTTDSEGNPFLAGDIISYEVYVWDMADGDVTTQPIAALTLVGTTVETLLQLAFDYRSEWAAAVRTVHTDGGGNVTNSDLAYSVTEVDTLSGPFWFSPVLTWVPMRPTGLRDSGM